ncbi:MAG: PqqD family protein, partial [Blastocatellia bacterium]|nr:PqqD family protein [Blastocatellia bacterium]
MNNTQCPIARKNGLVVQEVPDEVLVYDLETNKAHCLNQSAAMIWRSCDGKNSVSEIAALV